MCSRVAHRKGKSNCQTVEFTTAFVEPNVIPSPGIFPSPPPEIQICDRCGRLNADLGLQADSMVEADLQACKANMQQHISAGLQLFSYPSDLLRALHQQVNLSALLDSDSGLITQPEFQLPFNIVVGNDVDSTMHPYWFVRRDRYV
jgi:hypothetical protein